MVFEWCCLGDEGSGWVIVMNAFDYMWFMIVTMVVGVVCVVMEYVVVYVLE